MDRPRRYRRAAKLFILHVFRPGSITWLLHASRKKTSWLTFFWLIGPKKAGVLPNFVAAERI
jgi:hypothetical protein